MSDDLVEFLRKAEVWHMVRPNGDIYSNGAPFEAADEIERLREENEKLWEALDKCVEAMEFTYDYFDGPVAVVQDAKDAIRAAGAALKETGDEWRKQNDLD